jgi:hypothetical protein
MGIMGVMSGECDEQGNLYADSATRCIRASDGMVIRIVGGALPTGKPLPPEGPACMIDTRTGGGAYGGLGTSVAIQGLPLEGGDKGAIYLSGGSDYKTLLKVWKNQEKGGRWWYKEIIKLDFPCNGLQIVNGGKLHVFSFSEVFRYENDKLEKIFDINKFGLKARGGKFSIDGDGKTIFFGDNGEPGKIWRIPADLSKAEEYAGGFVPTGKRPCGAAKGFYMMCGPWIGVSGNFLPADTHFPSSADESAGRRLRDGRVSTLCKDGEWRELEGGQINQQALRKFRGWCPGPNGTAYSIYHGAGEIRVYRISGIDYAKPTVGPQAKGD